MAVAEPASRATEKTIGGILLVAFIAASAGFYVHTTSATSEDSPMDMQPGYVYNVSSQRLFFSQVSDACAVANRTDFNGSIRQGHTCSNR
jgi:hypothetical protein